MLDLRRYIIWIDNRCRHFRSCYIFQTSAISIIKLWLLSISILWYPTCVCLNGLKLSSNNWSFVCLPILILRFWWLLFCTRIALSSSLIKYYICRSFDRLSECFLYLLLVILLDFRVQLLAICMIGWRHCHTVIAMLKCLFGYILSCIWFWLHFNTIYQINSFWWVHIHILLIDKEPFFFARRFLVVDCA